MSFTLPNLSSKNPVPGENQLRSGSNNKFFIPSPFKLKPMVTVDISQLTAECNAWREALRSGREEFNNDKSRLQKAASQNLSKEQLEQVEHLHNQFHIQLINIHDLKQTIKIHDRKIQFEASANNGQVYEETLEEHENLLEEFQNLQQTLQELRDEFNEFLKRTG